MPKRRPVLVAIDHATDVERAIRAALGAADASVADVHVIRVAPHGAVDDRGPWPREGVRHVTLRGTAARVIPAYAQLTRARVLVVERDYGTSRFWRHAGVVEDLARRSPVPILVLPARPAHEGHPPRLRHIVTPVDFSLAAAVGLRTAVDLSRRHGARLTLVHALRAAPRDMVFSGGEAWDMIRSLPARVDAVAGRLRRAASVFGADTVATSVVTGAADGAILDAATRSDADMVVIGVPHRSWLDRIAFGSTLRRVLRRATQPVLVVPVTAGAHPWSVIEDHGTQARSASAVTRVAA